MRIFRLKDKWELRKATSISGRRALLTLSILGKPAPAAGRLPVVRLLMITMQRIQPSQNPDEYRKAEISAASRKFRLTQIYKIRAQK